MRFGSGRSILLSAALLLTAALAPVTRATVVGADGVVIGEYRLLSTTRISRTVFQYTYGAAATNWGASDAAIAATLASTAANITVVQGSLDFGNVIQGATQSSIGNFVVRVDRSAPFDPDALVWTAQATPLPPTTYALIDNAVAAGTLDAETGLLYKVYYEFQDTRFPAQYAGRFSGRTEATATLDAIMSYETLTAATQALLLPFLLPPDDPASWYQLRLARAAGSGASVRSYAQRRPTTAQAVAACGADLLANAILTQNGKVCVHYWTAAAYSAGTATDADLTAEAQGLADEIDATIWPALDGLLGDPPVGPSGVLNIYIAGGPALADLTGTPVLGTVPIVCGPSAQPIVYLVHAGPDFYPTAAHEMTHAFLDKYAVSGGCKSAGATWLQEASATWAEHFVYPNADTEWVSAYQFLRSPEISLENNSNDHAYGAYLFLLYLTQGASRVRNANTLLVPAIWQAFTQSSLLNAIDTVTGGLQAKWHDFVLYDWNRVIDHALKLTLTSSSGSTTTCDQSGGPYNFYAIWDCLAAGAHELTGATPMAVNLNGAVAKAIPMSYAVNHLGAAYFHFDLTKDPTIRRIRLMQPYFTNGANTKVWGLVKTDTGWQPAADWTGGNQKTLCRDKPGENFQELVIVISNSEFSNTQFVLNGDGTNTKLMVSALGCANWKGSAQGSTAGDFSTGDHLVASTAAENVKFERSQEEWTDSDDYQQFKITAGSVKWQATETESTGESKCTGSFSGSYALLPETFVEVESNMLQMGINQKPLYQLTGQMDSTQEGGSVDWGYHLLTCTPALPDGQYPPEAAIDSGVAIATWVLATDGRTNFPGIYDTSCDVKGASCPFAGELRGSFVPSTTESGTGGPQMFSWGFSKDTTFTDP